MKQLCIVMMLILLMTSVCTGAMKAVEGPKNCSICGMDRTAFAHSRMLIVYADESTVGVCSLHCAAAELYRNRDKQVDSLKVADYFSQSLTDATTATWIVGGKRSGVMTSLAKWAFAVGSDARVFVEENGGEVRTFEQAMKAATNEIMEQAAADRAAESELLRELQ